MADTNGTVVTVREQDLPDRLQEEAIADDTDPVDLFNQRIETISQWSESVEDGDRRAAVAYAIEEVIRTADTVDGEGGEFTDATDTVTENGGFDLRDHTATED